MNTFKNLCRSSLLCIAFLTACDSSVSPNSTVQPQSAVQSAGAASSTIAFTLPDRIRTSQAVNLAATIATVTTSAGDITLTRNGNQFEGSVDVAPGSNFSFTLTISENIGGQNIVYATSNGEINEPVNRDFEIVLSTGSFVYPDDDQDGATNLAEVEAGSNPTNSFSTPNDPNGLPPSETMPGLLQFTASAYTVAEADGQLVISVTRTGGSDGRVTVNYNLNSETAMAGRDFNASSGQLVWEDGDSTPKPFTVVVLSDDLNDGDQIFTAQLSNPAGGVAIGNGSAQINLTDSTPPAQRGTIQLTSGRYTVNEDTGVVEIEVERTGGSDGRVTIDYITNIGTASEADFAHITAARELSWADGEAGIQTISVAITNDTEVEPPETFTLTLSNNLGGAALGLAATTVIINDTTVIPVPGQLSFADSTYTVAEGDSVNIAVERLDGADGAAAVNYIVTAGTADAQDFTATSGSLSWGPGDNSPQSISISAAADDVLEASETIIVTLQSATGASIGSGTTTVTINDATVATPGVITFSSASAAVAEGSSVDIVVSRTGGTSGAVAVAVTAAASAEYTVSPTLLTWADGDSADKTITFTANEDDITDETEAASVTLSISSGDATLGNSSIAITINDTTVAPPEPEPEPPTDLDYVSTDGEWEVCIAPFNTSGPTAFATQLSANEGRVVSCVKTCDITTMVPDDGFPGWGWNATDLHSCVSDRDAGGTYTLVPIYTPSRETVNLSLTTQPLTIGNSIWACVNETRQNAEFTYVPDQTNTIWYQFLDDGTYFYGSSQDGSQPVDLLGPDIWSVNGRVLEIGHLNTGYRNTLFFPGNQTLHIHPTTDDRLTCTRETRPPSVSR